MDLAMPDIAEHMDTAAEENEVRVHEGIGNPDYGFPSVCMSGMKHCWLVTTKACEAVSMAIGGVNKQNWCQWLFWGHCSMEVELL